VLVVTEALSFSDDSAICYRCCHVLPVLRMTSGFQIIGKMQTTGRNSGRVWLWRQTVRNDVVNHVTLPRHPCYTANISFERLCRNFVKETYKSSFWRAKWTQERSRDCRLSKFELCIRRKGPSLPSSIASCRLRELLSTAKSDDDWKVANLSTWLNIYRCCVRL